LFVVAVAWGRQARRRRFLVSACIAVAAITLAYLMTVRPSDIPVEWITILTRGFERKSIMHLYTRGAHAGPNFAFVLSAIARGSAPNLHEVVWLNLLLALINAAIFLHVAIYLTGALWALPWTLVFALNPAMFLAAFSELPTNLLALYFLAGLLGWAVLKDAWAQPRSIRAAAAILCAALTVLTALTRSEVAAIGMIALSLQGGFVLLGAERWSAAWQRLRTVGERLLGLLSNHLGVVAVLCVAAWWGPDLADRTGIAQCCARSLAAGLYPFNPSILALFVFLPMLAFPIGASLAVLLGFVHAGRDLRRFGGLPLSLLVLASAYFAVQDSYYEMGRYLSSIMPAVLFLGLFGKQELDALAHRWTQNWQRGARVVYVMAWLVLPLPGVVELYLRAEYAEVNTLGGGLSQLLLDRNTQREVRHLLALTERNPQCVFVGRVVEDRGDFRQRPQYDYLFFGAPLAEPVLVPEKDAPLDQVIARYAAGASCIRLHYGGDCDVRFGDHCTQFIAGRRLIDEERFWSRPYNSNPLDSGAPEIVLATYAWP